MNLTDNWSSPSPSSSSCSAGEVASAPGVVGAVPVGWTEYVFTIATLLSWVVTRNGVCVSSSCKSGDGSYFRYNQARFQ